MSDPQDLLYTNIFSSTDVLSDKTLLEESKNYNRYKKYVEDSTKNDYNKYVDDNEYEESQININKTLYNKWPVNGKKNHYPLFDTYISDISTDRYKKEIITKVSIDSKNRNLSKYLNPNKFYLSLNRTFNNIKKVIINDLNFQNINKSILPSNNNLAWQYPSQNFLISNNIDFSIIPAPDSTKLISYSSLSNSVYSYTTTNGLSYVSNIDDYLVYQTNINPAFYTINTLINNIRLSTSEILHGQNAENQNIYVVEEPYLSSPGKIGNPHLFSCSINPVTSVVRFINRIEELKIVAMQTFSPYQTNFKDVDIFYYFSSLYTTLQSTYTLNTNYIYITVNANLDSSYQFYNNLYNLNTTNPCPLVLTGLTHEIGNINSNLICYTSFFDINIYLNNGYTESELTSVSYYKYIDTITIDTTETINGNVITVKNTYLRFGFRLSTGNLNGNNFNINGNPIIPVSTNNYILNSSLNSYFSKLNIFYNYDYYQDTVFVGRALLFRWIFDINNGSYVNYETEGLNEKKRSLLHILGWSISNQTFQIYIVKVNLGYSFIQTNYQSSLINQSGIIKYEEKQNNYPDIYLNLQNIGNEYYFVNNSYVYIKIYFNTVVSENTSNNFIVALSDENLQYNQNYATKSLLDANIGEDSSSSKNCNNITVLKKDKNNIFAKILLSNIPGNYDIQTSNIINQNSYVINYDSVQDNVNSVTIELYDPEFRLLNISNEYSFTMEIHEIHDVLKETLINTKTNNVSSTGNFI
jgi:hypothetical protein